MLATERLVEQPLWVRDGCAGLVIVTTEVPQ